MFAGQRIFLLVTSASATRATFQPHSMFLLMIQVSRNLYALVDLSA